MTILMNRWPQDPLRAAEHMAGCTNMTDAADRLLICPIVRNGRQTLDGPALMPPLIRRRARCTNGLWMHQSGQTAVHLREVPKVCGPLSARCCQDRAHLSRAAMQKARPSASADAVHHWQMHPVDWLGPPHFFQNPDSCCTSWLLQASGRGLINNLLIICQTSFISDFQYIHCM